MPRSGASRADVVRFVGAYYAQHGPQNLNDAKGARIVQAIDERFQQRAWRWLTRHPDIRVRTISIEDDLNGEGALRPTFSRRPCRDGTPLECSRGNAGDIPSPSSPYGFPDYEPTSDHRQLRVYACQQRMWHAIAGHGPDPVRILSLDFSCLSVIAAHRARGILQPDLVKVTGQDKRSVPKRTQRLRDRGYIVKIPVAAASTRTSLLILKRFADPINGQSIPGRPTTSSTFPMVEGEKNAQVHISNKFSDSESLIRNAVGTIKEHRVIEWDELKKKTVSYYFLMRLSFTSS